MVAREAGISRPAVWRWQQRYAEEGVDGLLRDKTRKPGKAPTPDDTVRRVVALTCSEPAGEAKHWTGRTTAMATGLSLRTVQRIWDAHDLQPHRLRTFKRSKDPTAARPSRRRSSTEKVGRARPGPRRRCGAAWAAAFPIAV